MVCYVCEALTYKSVLSHIRARFPILFADVMAALKNMKTTINVDTTLDDPLDEHLWQVTSLLSDREHSRQRNQQRL